MLKNIFIMLIIFVLLIFVNCSKKVEFSGMVYDDINKNNMKDTNETGLYNVKIESGNVEQYSDIDGNFSISGEIANANTKIKLYFSKEGYKEVEKEITIDYIDDEQSKLGPVNEDNNTVVVGLQKND